MTLPVISPQSEITIAAPTVVRAFRKTLPYRNAVIRMKRMIIAAGNLYTLSVSFADSSPNGGAFPETCRFPAGGIVCRPYSGIVR